MPADVARAPRPLAGAPVACPRSTTAQRGRPVPIDQRDLRRALAHLHDPVFLGTLRSASAVAPTGRLVPPGLTLQCLLMRAIDRLAPSDSRGPARHGRAGLVLRLRYLDGCSPEEVQRRLVIGKSQYYREHDQGVEALARIVDDALASEVAPPDDIVGHRPDDRAAPWLAVHGDGAR